jgi:hypothetical protein
MPPAPSGPRRGPRFWAANVIQRLVTLTTIDPVAAGVVRQIDASYTRGMKGATGTIIAGDSGDPVYRWNGYIDYNQMAHTSVMGAAATLRGDPNVALPATAGPLVVTTQAATNSVLSQLAAQEPGKR